MQSTTLYMSTTLLTTVGWTSRLAWSIICATRRRLLHTTIGPVQFLAVLETILRWDLKLWCLMERWGLHTHARAHTYTHTHTHNDNSLNESGHDIWLMMTMTLACLEEGWARSQRKSRFFFFFFSLHLCCSASLSPSCSLLAAFFLHLASCACMLGQFSRNPWWRDTCGVFLSLFF